MRRIVEAGRCVLELLNGTVDVADSYERSNDQPGRLFSASALPEKCQGGVVVVRGQMDLRVDEQRNFATHVREEVLAQGRALDFHIGGDRLLVDIADYSRITIEDLAATLVDEVEHPQAVGRRMSVAY